MARSGGKKPDGILKALNRGNEEASKVGAAWNNSDGSISVVLDPFVVLKGRGHGEDVVLTIFPAATDGHRRIPSDSKS